MRAWVLPGGKTGVDSLELRELPDPRPGPGEVLIRPRAWSLNYRDQMVLGGAYISGALSEDAIPLSDGVGEVVAVGAGVTAFKPGDRVAGTFHQNWEDGPVPADPGPSLGDGIASGMLAELVTLPERGVIHMAANLDYAQAATLPCAGVTAWNALFEGPQPVKPGQKVLLLGTGGVSILALQLAAAAGAVTIITSSSDEKLARAKALGATHTINYRDTPDWGNEVFARFGGADKVVEVGGAGTLETSLMAAAPNGEVAMIGVLQPEGGPNPVWLILRQSSLRGIFVGSAGMARRLNAGIEANGIQPVVGARFAFEDARAAYAHAVSKDAFAKTVIELG